MKTGWIYNFNKTSLPKNIAVMRVKIIDKQTGFVTVVPINEQNEYIHIDDAPFILLEKDVYKTKKQCVNGLLDFLKSVCVYFNGKLYSDYDFSQNDNMLYMHGYTSLYKQTTGTTQKPQTRIRKEIQ